MTGANAKIKRIMVGDKQVYPAFITETHTQTISKNNYYTITKSGYKIKSVRFQGNVNFNGSSQVYIRAAAGSAYGATSIGFVLDYWNSSHTLLFQYGYDGGSWTTYYTSSRGVVQSSNTIDFTITRDNIKAIFNNTEYSYTFNSSQKTNVEAILNNSVVSSVLSYYSSYAPYSTSITVTVTYEKI